MKLSKTNQKCQFSNKKDLKLIISLGYLPPVNEFLKMLQNKKNKLIKFEEYFETVKLIKKIYA